VTEPQQFQVGVQITGHAVAGPDGRSWGALDFRVVNSSWRVVLPPELLEQAGPLIAEKVSEVLDLVRQENGDALTVPATTIILPPGVKT
jgi:hypothetical protein